MVKKGAGLCKRPRAQFCNGYTPKSGGSALRNQPRAPAGTARDIGKNLSQAITQLGRKPQRAIHRGKHAEVLKLDAAFGARDPSALIPEKEGCSGSLSHFPQRCVKVETERVPRRLQKRAKHALRLAPQINGALRDTQFLRANDRRFRQTLLGSQSLARRTHPGRRDVVRAVKCEHLRSEFLEAFPARRARYVPADGNIIPAVQRRDYKPPLTLVERCFNRLPQPAAFVV